MALVTLRDLRQLLHPHYFFNLLLATSYIFLKTCRPVCYLLFPTCELDYSESEILFFTAVVIVFRTRKQGAVTFVPYLSTACMFAKLGNILLYFYSDVVYGVLFVTACLLHLLLLPEPVYRGPENILHFKDSDLQEEIRNKNVTWLIELYTAWSPPCIEFAHNFSELSAKYTLDNLKFGKVDLSRNPEAAERFKINTSSLSKQLPTLILFKNGREEMRRPIVNSNGKLLKFPFNYDNVVTEFDLNNLYQECKNNPLRSKQSRTKEE